LSVKFETILESEPISLNLMLELGTIFKCKFVLFILHYELWLLSFLSCAIYHIFPLQNQFLSEAG